MLRFLDAGFELTEADPFAAEREAQRRLALSAQIPVPPRTVARWRVVSALGAAIVVWSGIAAQVTGPPGISTVRVAVPATPSPMPAVSPVESSPAATIAAPPAAVPPATPAPRPSPPAPATPSPAPFSPGPSAHVTVLPTPTPSPTPASILPTPPPLPVLPGATPSPSPSPAA